LFCACGSNIGGLSLNTRNHTFNIIPFPFSLPKRKRKILLFLFSHLCLMGTILELENSATNLFCLLSFSCGFPGALFISHLILSFCLQVEKVKQDDGLNDLSNLLVELKGMAVDMGTEMGRLVMLIQLHWSI
jgi:hypothetical protein